MFQRVQALPTLLFRPADPTVSFRAYLIRAISEESYRFAAILAVITIVAKLSPIAIHGKRRHGCRPKLGYLIDSIGCQVDAHVPAYVPLRADNFFTRPDYYCHVSLASCWGNRRWPRARIADLRPFAQAKQLPAVANCTSCGRSKLMGTATRRRCSPISGPRRMGCCAGEE